MKNMLKLNFILLISFALAGNPDQPDTVTKEATAGFNFLKLETGIRAIGMAGAQVAAGQGVEAIPYNPASISSITRSDAYLSKASLYSVDINHHIIAFAQKVTPSDYIGGHLMFLDSGEMEETTTEDSDGTGGYFRLYDFALSITYARRMTDRLNLGVTMKYVRESYVNVAAGAQAIALDIGSIFDTGLWGMILGMSVSNFGPELQYHGDALEIGKNEITDAPEQSVTKTWPLPLIFRMGIKTDIIGKDSYYIKDSIHKLTFALDGVDPVDNLLMGNIGLEYAWNQLVFVRTGYHINHDTAGLALGSGVKLNLSGIILNLDYAFVNYGDLNSTHQFGMNFKF